MKCKKFKDMISEYLDSGLSGHERLEFEIHAEECLECGRELERTEDLLLHLGAIGSQKSPANCWAGVRAEIMRRSVKPTWRSIILRPIVAGPALAAALIGATLALWPWAVQDNPAQPPMPASEYANYISAHSYAHSIEPMSDPDVAYVSAELEKASLVKNTVK